MKNIKSFDQFTNESEVNEGFLDAFKRRKKEVVKEKPIDYNPKKDRI